MPDPKPVKQRYPRWVWFLLAVLWLGIGGPIAAEADNTPEKIGALSWSVVFLAIGLWPRRKEPDGVPESPAPDERGKWKPPPKPPSGSTPGP